MSVNNDYVIVYDQWQRKAIKFNHSGKIWSDHAVPFFCRKIIPLSNGEMLCFGESADNYHIPSIIDYCCWLCDSTYRHITKVGLYSEHNKTIPYWNLLVHNYDSQLFYFSITKNSFYKIVPDSCFEYLAKVRFFPEYPDEFYTDAKFRKDQKWNHNAVSVSDFFMTDKYAFFCVSGHAKSPCYVYYNFTDNSYKYYNQMDFEVSQISRLIYDADVLTLYNDLIVFCLSPDVINDMVHAYSAAEENLWENASEQVKKFDNKLLESLHDEDNDILVFAKIKEHFD